jgi:hypothetical protein
MGYPAHSASLVIALAFILAPPAQAAARIEFIDTGTPKNGTLEMTGWRGIIVRGVLDDGLPITRVDFGNGNEPRAGFIRGNMAERWTDPTGQGNYTQTSPGPNPANNSFESSFNFDSHFLGTAEMFQIQSIGETSLTGFFPERTGIPSDGFVGYGATLPERYDNPFLYGSGGTLAGRYSINPPFQADSLDIAYVVADGPFSIFGNLFSGEQRFQVSAEYPEPSSMAIIALGVAASLLRRTRKQDGDRFLFHSTLSNRAHS